MSLCVVTAALAMLCCERGALAQVFTTDDFKHTFFAGAFFDPKASSSSHLVKYLVTPNASFTAGRCRALLPATAKAAARPWHGNELSPMACDVLSASPLIAAAGLQLIDGSAGNPVALYISRAQHETARIDFPGHTAYYTVVSIAVALDIFTDQAAARSTRQFESLYSRLHVVEQPLLTDTPLSEEALKQQYQALFRQAVGEVAAQAAEDLRSSRSRSAAVFQIDIFRLPSQLPPELEQLVEASLSADGKPLDAAERRRETERLTLEFQHTLHQFVVAELRRRGLSQIAVLPPQTAWTDAYVLRLLSERATAFEGSAIVNRINPAQINGYTVTAVLAVSTVTSEERPGIASRVFAAQIAARVLRPRAGGSPDIMPASISDPLSKTAVGSGGEGYLDIAELQRRTTREIALSAIRRASNDLAPKLVELMVQTANEVNR